MAEIYQKATSVRSNFSMVMDQAIFERPQFIRRTHDRVILLSNTMMSALLHDVVLSYVFEENNQGFLVTNNVIEDIIGVGVSKKSALEDFCVQLLAYAQDYYEEFGLYSRSPNRKDHLPYVIRMLSIGTPEGLGEMLQCQAGGI